MIVVADTSPINYLIQIRLEWILPRLYQTVLIVPSVLDELRHERSPQAVKLWTSSLPEWIDIRSVLPRPDDQQEGLHQGELDSIHLAEESGADFLLIDERKGTTVAIRHGLSTTGTLGVLLSAHEAGLIDATTAYASLIEETSFRITPPVQHLFFRAIRS